MQISAVIPTCNRKARLLALLHNLNDLSFPLHEVIVVDSGEDQLKEPEYARFSNLAVRYITSEKSVCIQRNSGIQKAVSPWIFLCDDDMEIPAGYLQSLTAHIRAHPEAGAVSGLWLQHVNHEWKATYPEDSGLRLCWKYIFQLSIWGEISCPANNLFIRRIKKYYKRKGNHLSKAGWPVITDFNGGHFITPLYSLGAALVKRDWLLISPYDEVLDPHGMGDHYGVLAGFPQPAVHVLTQAPVYHHQEQLNRLQRPLQYYRRVLALAYFIKTKSSLKKIKPVWLIWSLKGNLLRFIFSDRVMIGAALKSIWVIVTGQNPYYVAAKKGEKTLEPLL